MGTAAPFPTFSRNDAPAPDGVRRRLSRWGLLGSVLLHGVAIACVVERHYGAAPEEPSAIQVSLAQEPAMPVVEKSPQPQAVSQPAAPPVRSQLKPAAMHPAVLVHRLAATPSFAASQPVASLQTAAIVQALPQRANATDISDTASVTGEIPGNRNGSSSSGSQGTAPDGPAVPVSGNAPPVYPMTARRAGREGRTILSVIVTNTGECKEVSIEESSGTPPLDDAAVAAVQHWRFNPATRNGRSIETIIRVPVLFVLAALP